MTFKVTDAVIKGYAHDGTEMTVTFDTGDFDVLSESTYDDVVIQESYEPFKRYMTRQKFDVIVNNVLTYTLRIGKEEPKIFKVRDLMSDE